jgi:hypothetical protein
MFSPFALQLGHAPLRVMESRLPTTPAKLSKHPPPCPCLRAPATITTNCQHRHREQQMHCFALYSCSQCLQTANTVSFCTSGYGTETEAYAYSAKRNNSRFCLRRTRSVFSAQTPLMTFGLLGVKD